MSEREAMSFEEARGWHEQEARLQAAGERALQQSAADRSASLQVELGSVRVEMCGRQLELWVGSCSTTLSAHEASAIGSALHAATHALWEVERRRDREGD